MNLLKSGAQNEVANGEQTRWNKKQPSAFKCSLIFFFGPKARLRLVKFSEHKKSSPQGLMNRLLGLGKSVEGVLMLRIASGMNPPNHYLLLLCFILMAASESRAPLWFVVCPIVCLILETYKGFGQPFQHFIWNEWKIMCKILPFKAAICKRSKQMLWWHDMWPVCCSVVGAHLVSLFAQCSRHAIRIRLHSSVQANLPSTPANRGRCMCVCRLHSKRWYPLAP